MFSVSTRFDDLPIITTYDTALAAYLAAPVITKGRAVGMRPVGRNNSARRAADVLFWVPDLPVHPVNARNPSTGAPLIPWNGARGVVYDYELQHQPTVFGADEYPEFNPVMARTAKLRNGIDFCPFTSIYTPPVDMTYPIPDLTLPDAPQASKVDEANPRSLTMWSGSRSSPHMCVTWGRFATDPHNSDAPYTGDTYLEVRIPEWRSGISGTVSDGTFLENALRGYGVRTRSERGVIMLDIPLPELAEAKARALGVEPGKVVQCVGAYTLLVPYPGVLRFLVRRAPEGASSVYGYYLLPINPAQMYVWSVDRKATNNVSKRYGAFQKFIKIMNGIRAQQATVPRHTVPSDGSTTRQFGLVPITYAEFCKAIPRSRSFTPGDNPEHGGWKLRMREHRQLAEHVCKPEISLMTLVPLMRRIATEGAAAMPTLTNHMPRAGQDRPPPDLRAVHRPASSHKLVSRNDPATVHRQQLLWHRWAEWFLGSVADEYKPGKAPMMFTPEQYDRFMRAYVVLAVAVAVLPEKDGHSRGTAMRQLRLLEHDDNITDATVVAVATADEIPLRFREIMLHHHCREVYVRKMVAASPDTNPNAHAHMQAVDVEQALQAALAEYHNAIPTTA